MAQPGVLHRVGVLKLIDQNMFEARTVLFTQRRVVAPKLKRAQQQLGKIDGAGAVAGLLVGLVNPHHGGHIQVTRRLDVLRTQAFILLRVDPPLGLPRRPLVVVQPQLTDNPLDQSLLVIAVEDLKLLYQAGLTPVRAQQAVRQAVKGANPHALRRNAQQLLDPPAHFVGGLIGKGDRQNAPGRGLFDLHQPRYAVHQYAGFAGASPSQHQLLTNRGADRLTLGFVERIKQVGNIHRGILGKHRSLPQALCERSAVQIQGAMCGQ